MKKLFIVLLLFPIAILPVLIELGPLPENALVNKESVLATDAGKFYVNTEIVDHIIADSYSNLIAEQQAKGLPYILAIATTQEAGNKILYSAYDAHGLNKYLFEDLARPYFRSRYNAEDCKEQKFTDFLRRPIIDKINYYLINRPDDAAAILQCTDYDLLEDPNKKFFMRTFFRANLNSVIDQYKVGCLFKIRGNLEQAKHYYQLAANQGKVPAQQALRGLEIKMARALKQAAKARTASKHTMTLRFHPYR